MLHILLQVLMQLYMLIARVVKFFPPDNRQ